MASRAQRREERKIEALIQGIGLIALLAFLGFGGLPGLALLPALLLFGFVVLLCGGVCFVVWRSRLVRGKRIGICACVFGALVVGIWFVIKAPPMWIEQQGTITAISAPACTVETDYMFRSSAGNVTVTAASLTITASAQSATYGTAFALGNSAFTTSGLQNGETVGGVTLKYNGATTVPATTAAGTYAASIVASAATGGSFVAANYSITYAPGDWEVVDWRSCSTSYRSTCITMRNNALAYASKLRQLRRWASPQRSPNTAADPHHDLDTISFGLVAAGEMNTEPRALRRKAVFHTAGRPWSSAAGAE